MGELGQPLPAEALHGAGAVRSIWRQAREQVQESRGHSPLGLLADGGYVGQSHITES